ncbi:MAG TPA: hypothetical protein VIV11_31020 [Kofleriaceae bacterium]
MRWLVAAVLGACATGQHAAQPQPPLRASVEVAASGCVAAADVTARITQVFATHKADRSGLVCKIVETAGDASTAVTLQVVRASGEVGLDRAYTFGPTDCASAPQLLALTVDRWLSSFPEWADPPAPPRAPTRWTEVTALAALHSMWLPLGLDGQAGALVDHGGRGDRFGGSLLVRASIPQRAGDGRFQQTTFLVGAGWRHERGTWITRFEARAGPLLVSGIGYAENGSDWLVWWEGAGFVGRAMSWGAIGVEVAATALRHRAVTRDGLVSEDIPLLRIGLGGMFGVVTK